MQTQRVVLIGVIFFFSTTEEGIYLSIYLYFYQTIKCESCINNLILLGAGEAYDCVVVPFLFSSRSISTPLFCSYSNLEGWETLEGLLFHWGPHSSC